MSEFTLMRRLKDGKILPIQNRFVDSNLKRGFERVEKEKVVYADSDIKFEKPKDTPDYECPLCGEVSKNEEERQEHKKSHYEDSVHSKVRESVGRGTDSESVRS